MLHYGYFENTEIEVDTISIAEIEKAQVRYAQNIIVAGGTLSQPLGRHVTAMLTKESCLALFQI